MGCIDASDGKKRKIKINKAITQSKNDSNNNIILPKEKNEKEKNIKEEENEKEKNIKEEKKDSIPESQLEKSESVNKKEIILEVEEQSIKDKENEKNQFLLKNGNPNIEIMSDNQENNRNENENREEIPDFNDNDKNNDNNNDDINKRFSEERPNLKIEEPPEKKIKNFINKRTLYGHSDKVTSLIKLMSGKIATGSYDNTIRIWDIIDNPSNV